MEDNQTYINISAFQHNDTNYIQHISCSFSTLWIGFCQLRLLHYINLLLFWVVFFVVFPGICFALHKLNSQVRPDLVAPVYVTNLLISDLIQICANPVQMTAEYHLRWIGPSGEYHLYYISWYGNLIYLFSVQVNVLFMMCVSAERYVMVAHAVWYRNIPNRKVSVIVSVTIWTLSAISWIISFSSPAIVLPDYVMGTVLLLPYPLVMFFFVATWRALSRSSVPHNDQTRIRSILGLILGIYTILFMPFIIIIIDPFTASFDPWFVRYIAYILVALNPPFDLLLYVFMRKDVTDMCRALLFCCNRRQGADITHS